MLETNVLMNKLLFYTSLCMFLAVGIKVANIVAKAKDKKKYFSIVLSVLMGFLLSYFLLDANPLAIKTFGKFNYPYSQLLHWLFILLIGGVFAVLVVLSIIKSKKW